MKWGAGELRDLEIGTSKKRRGKNSYEITWEQGHIPAPYDRIICQLLMEDQHGELHKSHEALRRQSYARQVLDEFTKEFMAYNGPTASFRSQVLTPILQRQLMGVTDAHTPAVMHAIADSDQLTIEQATEFYLADDPTSPELIPAYRYHMVYIPEVRWHLGTVMGKVGRGIGSGYNRIRTNQDILMTALKKEGGIDVDGDEVPPFGPAEVRIIIDEGLERFFQPELERVVCILSPPCTAH